MASEPESTPNRLRWLLVGAAVLGLIAVIVWWPGCRKYPAVTSPEALQLSKLLYSACNTKNTMRIDEVETRVNTLSAEGKMTAKERASFEAIIALARASDWKRAEDEAFRFSKDQVGQGTP